MKIDKLLFVVAILLNICLLSAQADAAAIPQREMSKLQSQLEELEETESSLEKRRLCKRIIRKGESLLESSPNAANRFQLLALLLETKQELYTVSQSQQNAATLLETCRALSAAPNSLAKLRLPADAILAQLEIDGFESGSEEADKPITDLIQRYRKTSVEVDCLCMAFDLALESGCVEMFHDIRSELIGRCKSDPEVYAYLNKRIKRAGLCTMFKGRFARADGTVVQFPQEQKGKVYVVCFWSTKADSLDRRLRELHEMKTGCKLTLYSINIDELPDHGQKQLKRLGLDWTVLQLPEGESSRSYSIYGDPRTHWITTLIVDEQGVATPLLSFKTLERHDNIAMREVRLELCLKTKYWKGVLREAPFLYNHATRARHAQFLERRAKGHFAYSQALDALGKRGAAGHRKSARDLMKLALPRYETWLAGLRKRGVSVKVKADRVQERVNRCRAFLTKLNKLVEKDL